MVIAVNISPLFPGIAEEDNFYLLEITGRLARMHPEHTFVVIVGNDFQVTITGSNIKVITAGPRQAGLLRRTWWTDRTLPGLLKKCGADLLLSAGYICLRTPIPQKLLLTTLITGEGMAAVPKTQAAFFDRNMPRYLDRAETIIVFSAAVKRDILNRYSLAEDKLQVVPPFTDALFRPLDYAGRQQVKEKYTNGREYLLYNGAVHAGKNLLHLLKAFSIFKKKQKTGMKLVFAGSPAASFSSFLKDLQTYRFRDDILFTGSLAPGERAALTGGAYALVYPSAYEGMAQPVMEALQCGIPVICSPGSATGEKAGEAALYADPADMNDLAEKMILLYKDETLRGQLIREGLAAAQRCNQAAAGDMLWNYIIRK